MAKMILVGLVEPPSAEAEERFRERYLGNHIEDIANCPGFLSGTVYELEHAHDGFPVISRFLTIYELEADSWEEADANLKAWISDPEAWPKRLSGEGALAIVGSGWYRFERAHHTRA